MSYVLLSYDVIQNSVRYRIEYQKIHKFCSKRGLRINYSVFLFPAELKAEIVEFVKDNIKTSKVAILDIEMKQDDLRKIIDDYKDYILSIVRGARDAKKVIKQWIDNLSTMLMYWRLDDRNLSSMHQLVSEMAKMLLTAPEKAEIVNV